MTHIIENENYLLGTLPIATAGNFLALYWSRLANLAPFAHGLQIEIGKIAAGKILN